jgi:hypothetical protein
MPFSDDQLMDFMKETIKTTTATATTVNDMKERLFGDGGDGSGALAKLYEISQQHNNAAVAALTAHAAQDIKDFGSVNKNIAKVSKKVTWFSASVATAGAIGTFVLGLLTWHAAEVAAKAAVVANHLSK